MRTVDQGQDALFSTYGSSILTTCEHIHILYSKYIIDHLMISTAHILLQLATDEHNLRISIFFTGYGPTLVTSSVDFAVDEHAVLIGTAKQKRGKRNQLRYMGPFGHSLQYFACGGAVEA